MYREADRFVMEVIKGKKIYIKLTISVGRYWWRPFKKKAIAEDVEERIRCSNINNI